MGLSLGLFKSAGRFLISLTTTLHKWRRHNVEIHSVERAVEAWLSEHTCIFFWLGITAVAGIPNNFTHHSHCGAASQVFEFYFPGEARSARASSLGYIAVVMWPTSESVESLCLHFSIM